MKRNIFFTTLLALMLCLAACNNEDINIFSSQPQDAKVDGKAESITVSALTFAWDAVAGVDQYGYKLVSENDITVAQGITKNHSIYFSGLTPSTKYTLQVQAFGHNGQPTKCFSITLRTNDVVKLAAPDAASFTSVVENGLIVISWNEVQNAAYYSYKVTDTAGEEVVAGTVETNSVQLSGLKLGKYTITVTACNDDEAFENSDPTAFEFNRERMLIETKTGKWYQNSSTTGVNRTLEIYDDGSYIVRSFYGHEGYDLEFSIPGSDIKVLNGYESGTWLYIYTGDATYSYMTVYNVSGYYGYASSESGKYIYFYYYDALGAYCTDMYVWDASTGDDVAGTYTTTSWLGYELGSSWLLSEKFSSDDSGAQPWEVNVTKGSDSKVTISNLFGWGETIEGTYSSGTITVSADAEIYNDGTYSYLIFGGHEGMTAEETRSYYNTYNTYIPSANAKLNIVLKYDDGKLSANTMVIYNPYSYEGYWGAAYTIYNYLNMKK